jgi:hypothetical protein
MTEEERRAQQQAAAQNKLPEWLGGGVGGKIDKQLTNTYARDDSFDALRGFGQQAGAFSQQGQQNYNQLTMEGRAARQRLADLASGKNSISAEQLRQGLQQNMAGQMAMAGAARPGNAAMAARTASMNAGAMGSGLAGQQAMAGIAERNAATMGLNQAIQGMRSQDLQAAQGSLGQAIGAEQGIHGIASADLNAANAATKAEERAQWDRMEKLGTVILSDRTQKTAIADGGKDADDFIASLRSYSFKYKNAKNGQGDRVGIMAQDLEKTKAGRMAVLNTREGKKVDTAHLSGALAAATARLGERLDALEKNKKR